MNFDRVVVADWSASSRPVRGRDSIWIAVAECGSDAITTTNPSTRAEATAALFDVCRRPGSTLLGVDFSLGYPAGTAALLGLDGVPWRATWKLLAELIDDADDNRNNRFVVAAELNRRMGDGPGPFWGCPASVRSPTLTSTKVAPTPLGEWRRVEHRLRTTGYRPFSAWQLLGAGSVGSQTLLGIPRLVELISSSTDVGRSVAVWPFDVALVAGGGADLVIAEVWPSLHASGPPAALVRDEAQVIETARRLVGGVELTLSEAPDVVAEEGWILGA